MQVTPLSDWRAERTADCAVRARAAVSRAERRRAIVGFWGGVVGLVAGFEMWMMVLAFEYL